ncbi:hypothetical protein [Agarilytica rhodophyticola]|uniref:hypothetical protein n=1 Tax=Agarilytica rhodophyticola TaxID=1737490 RepID=UPI000B34848B|nr:hypothetical protein [Agarilytica rhodophyticola]
MPVIDKKKLKGAPMPEVYITDMGRVVRANPYIHEAVLMRKLNYQPSTIAAVKKNPPKEKSISKQVVTGDSFHEEE